MTFEQVMPAVMRMLTATDAVAAIGADLSLRTSGQTADPQVAAGLADVIAAAGLPDLGTLPPPQQMMLLNMIRLYMRQAADLLDDPAQEPGWRFEDPMILEGIGRSSMMLPPLMAAAPELANVTSVLDVGVGVGWLAIGAANTWPAATVVGIDIFETALDRARVNVKEAGLDAWISLRNQSVAALDDVNAYDCAWIPTFFIPEAILTSAVANVARAVRPDGWIVLGMFAEAPDPVLQTTMALKNIRSGGSNLTIETASKLLDGAGCTAVHPLERSGPIPIQFVIGQKPVA